MGYVADVVFKKGTKKLMVHGKEESFIEDTYIARFEVDTNYRYDTPEWENAIIDSLLDMLKGTDMSTVVEFVYL